jgi:DNA-binding winged helix-turn-helix (wHTH) protein
MTVHVRPQLMELLVFLAEHAAEVALKNEILDQVWNGRFVAESCLTKCIAQLRTVLGGQPHDRNFIETIPKRGYRLVAPVHPILEPDRGAKSRVAAGRSGAPERLPVTVAVLLGIGVGLVLGWCAAGRK